MKAHASAMVLLKATNRLSQEVIDVISELTDFADYAPDWAKEKHDLHGLLQLANKVTGVEI
jgi:hypothetical protein